MSLRTRTSPLPQVPKTEHPLPDPDRTHPATAGGPDGLRRGGWPSRLALLRRCERPNRADSGGWFVAGASGDVGRKESVTRTIAGREVVFWRNSAGELVAGPGRVPAPRGAVGQVPSDGRHHVLPVARPCTDPKR